MVEHQTSGTFVLVVGRVMRYLICCPGTADLYLAVLKAIFNLFLGHPPPGVPGEGPDCQLPEEIMGLGPIYRTVGGRNR